MNTYLDMFLYVKRLPTNLFNGRHLLEWQFHKVYLLLFLLAGNIFYYNIIAGLSILSLILSIKLSLTSEEEYEIDANLP